MILRKALVAVDLSSTSTKVVEFAFQYAGKTGLDSIDFIHVLEYHDQEIPLHSEFAARFDTDKVKQDVLDVLKKAVHKTGSSLAHNLYVKTGDPSKEIVKMAEKEKHDIILIGHRGMSDLEEFFIGSVAAKVARHAPCDVLVHKP